jgi:hypothetical protein
MMTVLGPLAGTIIGGVIAWLAARSVARRADNAERERDRKKQITDISIRFIHAVEKQSVESLKLKETMGEFQTKFEQALVSGDPTEARSALKTLEGADAEQLKAMFTDVQAQLTAAAGLLAGVGESGPALAELKTLLSEMRLVLPNDVIRVAEMVGGFSYGLGMFSSALPSPLRIQIASSVTAALNVYVNAVRREMGLPVHIPENRNLQDIEKDLKELEAQQKAEGSRT